MPVCFFCKESYDFPKGTTVVQKDGSARYFCSSKCRKNSEMGRLAKKVKWIRKSVIVKEEKAKKDVARAELLAKKKAEAEAKLQAKTKAKKK